MATGQKGSWFFSYLLATKIIKRENKSLSNFIILHFWSIVFKILCNLVWRPTLRFKYWIDPNQGAIKLVMLKVVTCVDTESILPWSLKRMHITRHCIICPSKMCAKHARILSLLEMSAVMLGTVGEVSVPVIQATVDTNVKSLVRIF